MASHCVNMCSEVTVVYFILYRLIKLFYNVSAGTLQCMWFQLSSGLMVMPALISSMKILMFILFNFIHFFKYYHLTVHN